MRYPELLINRLQTPGHKEALRSYLQSGSSELPKVSLGSILDSVLMGMTPPEFFSIVLQNALVRENIQPEQI